MGRIHINGTGYDVEAVTDGGRVVGLRLVKDDDTVYHLDTSGRDGPAIAPTRSTATASANTASQSGPRWRPPGSTSTRRPRPCEKSADSEEARAAGAYTSPGGGGRRTPGDDGDLTMTTTTTAGGRALRTFEGLRVAYEVWTGGRYVGTFGDRREALAAGRRAAGGNPGLLADVAVDRLPRKPAGRRAGRSGPVAAAPAWARVPGRRRRL